MIQTYIKFNQSAIDISIIFIICYNVYNVVLNVIGFQLYAYHGVHRIVAVRNISLHDVYTPALNTFGPFFVLKRSHYFSMNKTFIIPYLLLLSCSPVQSDIVDVFCLFCISRFLNLHSKSLKRGAVFPPLSVSLQCTFLSCIFVQCCAF